MARDAHADLPSERPEDLVAGYLHEFETAAGTLAPGPRGRAVRRIRRLLREDLLDRNATPGEVRRYLRDLGTPRELGEKASAAHGRRGSSAVLSIMAAVMTPLCWPVGMPLLWYSRYWNRTEKLVATLLVPGGVPAAFYLWPALLRVAVDGVWSEVAGTVLPLLSAAVAFYLVGTFVLRVDDDALGTGLRRDRR